MTCRRKAENSERDGGALPLRMRKGHHGNWREIMNGFRGRIICARSETPRRFSDAWRRTQGRS